MVFIFIFLCFLGGVAIDNAYGDVFWMNLNIFQNMQIPLNIQYYNVNSQISETLFILAIPFSQTFCIKQVMLISMLAWVLRLVVVKTNRWFMDDHYVCVVYGMAFDFFNISGFVC
jgi:NHS family xanthosine MFS transporter